MSQLPTLPTAASAPPVRPTTPCFYGNSFCVEGLVNHGACQGPLLTVYVPGFNGPVPTLDAQIMDLGEGPVLSFSGDAHDSMEITPAKLRTVVADVRNHLDRLLGLADEFEAGIVEVAL